MPKYMIIASYTAEGAKGLLKDGGSARRQVAEKAIASAGGAIESFYFGFGADDAYVIFDAPDNASSAAAALVVGSSGAINSRTVVLLTPEEIDQAAKRSAKYSPPGK